ncbi:YncE family protein [Paractinoplanes maris]|uniref:YncE family protein n=1 Tax=Paractinoplanes maris TaxID=1734446 RepID=UPI00201FE6B0|nr:lactonase family protein [Actinoplanes maris]
MRSPVVFLAALVTCLGGLAVAPGTAQAAAQPTVTVLPFGNPADVVSSGDRVFVSGGRDTTQIVVTSATGVITGTIDGLAGPTDLQLSNDRRTLYVALPEAGRIAAYDTGSLTQSALYDTGAGGCPSTLAFGGRYLWFGYGCGGWDGQIGKIDLARQPAVVTTGLAAQTFYGAPRLATALRNTKVLFAGQESLSPWTGYSYTIGAAGALTHVSTTDHVSVGSNLGDAALDPTGTTVYTASGAPYYVQSFSMADLTQAGPTYSTGPYPDAVELTRDGTRLAGGVSSSYDADVFVFGVDGAEVAQFELGGQDHLLVRGGLAWAPNGRRLYAISNDGYFYENPAQLHVLPIPAA